MAKARKTVAELGKLLAEAAKAIDVLRARRKALAEDVTALSAEIDQMRGETVGAPVQEVPVPAKPARKKAAKKRIRRVAKAQKAAKKSGRKTRRPGTREAMLEILRASEKPLRVAQIVERLAASGCKTKSVNPKNMVGAMLAQSADFERVARGLYAVKKR